MYKLFVYGTLKSDGLEHYRISGAKFLGVGYTKAEYVLFTTRDNYPNIKNGNQKIKGEIFLVSRNTLLEIDEYEKPYKRKVIYLEDNCEVLIYYYDGS